MKKAFLFLLLLNLLTAASFAQDLITKVPSEATLVLKYSGASLSQKLPAAKFDSYSSLKKKLFEDLKLDPKTSLDDMGIDLQQNAYQYLIATDTTSGFVTIAYIKDSIKFNKFIQKKNAGKQVYESKTGFQLYTVANSVYLAWNGKLASLIVFNYNDDAYYQAPYTVDSSKMYTDVAKTTPYADSSLVIEETRAATDTVKMDTVATTTAVDSVQTAVQMAVDSAKMAIQAAEDSVTAIKEKEASDKFYAAKEIKDSIIEKGLAENIFLAVYDSTVASIQNNNLYNKLIDNSADISVWVGSYDIFDNMGLYHMPYRYFSYGDLSRWLGYRQGINVYFEGDKMRVQQKLSCVNDSSLQLFKNVFNNRQSPSLINYLHPDDLGYVSLSINTEGMINYYYPLLKATLSGMTYLNKYSEEIDAYVDFLQIAIDEKALSDMIPGNAMFVLHNLKPKQVSYMSYEYDKEFNSTPKEEIKTEMSPDFTFVFETKNEKIFDKFINLPVHLGKEGNFNYTKTGDYYTWVLGKDELIDKLYFMVKNGKCIITTSLQDIALKDIETPVNQTNSINPAIKQSILNSNYSGMFDIKSLVKNLSPMVTDKNNKKMMSYLQDNVKDFTFESSLKGDIVETTAVLNIAGDHKNSLQYFFDVLEKLMDLNVSGH